MQISTQSNIPSINYGTFSLHLSLVRGTNIHSLFVFALFIARFGLASIHKFAFRMIGIRISAAVRLRYLRRLFDQSMHVLDSMPPGQAVGTITSSSNTVQSGISEKLALFIEYTTMIIASFVVSLVWNWELSLVTMAGFVVVVLVVGTLFPLTMKGQARQIELDGQAASIASESFASIRMIMACGAQQQTVSKYRAFVEAVKKQAQSTNPLTSLQFSLTVSPDYPLRKFKLGINLDSSLESSAPLLLPSGTELVSSRKTDWQTSGLLLCKKTSSSADSMEC